MRKVVPETTLGMGILQAEIGDPHGRPSKTNFAVVPESELTIMHGQALQDEAKYKELRWNGITCFSVMPYLVKLLPFDPENANGQRGTHWQFAFAGSERQVLIVMVWAEQPKKGKSVQIDTFIVDNEDGFGFRKLMLGGMFNMPHRSLSSAYLEAVQPLKYSEVKKERDVEAYNRHYEEYIKWLWDNGHIELHARLLAIREKLLQQ